jgi:hypothetical protein
VGLLGDADYLRRPYGLADRIRTALRFSDLPDYICISGSAPHEAIIPRFNDHP